MMKDIDDGGRAFPNTFNDGELQYCEDGMTRRDWLAGLAMQGFIASGHNFTYAQAYGVADALIAEGKAEEKSDTITLTREEMITIMNLQRDCRQRGVNFTGCKDCTMDPICTKVYDFISSEVSP